MVPAFFLQDGELILIATLIWLFVLRVSLQLYEQ